MALKIELWADNKILRAKSSELTKNELKQYGKLAKEMYKYIKNPKNWWAWLAAPQVWVNKRIIVVNLIENREDEQGRIIVMINPEILESSKETNVDSEWCLSLPGTRGKVSRVNEIKVRFWDEKGKENVIIAKMLASRIVLHEIDHLDGILFIDKLENTWT